MTHVRVIFGSIEVDGEFQAARWTVLPEVGVSFAPTGATSSSIRAAEDHQQVGSAEVDGMGGAWLWANAGNGSISLRPADATSSTAYDCEQGLQCGSAFIDGANRAVLWMGDAESYDDLHAMLPDALTLSIATGVDLDAPDSRVRVVGYGFNADNDRFEALMWINDETVPCPGDVDQSGVVDVSDLLSMLAAWGSCGDPCPQDTNSDGAVDVTDLLTLLGNWGPC